MTKKPYFRLSIISCLLISCYVKAETQSIKDTKEAISSEVDTQSTEDSELETISVTAEKVRDRKDNEVTGLGKIIKTSESISREQVLNIRDLTRYDPGISVVEQGRGASSGYSIRGMDRNRVALLVDGLPQTQSYVVQSPLVARSGYSGTGAINEIEYENVKAVEISKGGSSSEYGNGALAGSVTFQSKSAADILEGDKSWGIQTKNAYSSKNKGFTHSLAVAGKQGGFEGLAIYTQRNSEETQVHPDALKGVQSYERFIAKTDDKTHAHFVIQGECPNSNNYEKCVAKPPAILSTEKETVSVSDYTGANRIKPNPMKYESQSWFLRGGYHFSEQHYIGGIFEFTQQKFDIRDMTFPAYLRSTEDKDLERPPFYPKQDYGAYQRIGDGRGVKYASGLYFDEHHRKQRVGIEYIYENKNKAGIIDKAVLSANQQNIILDSYMQHTHCSLYPNPSKNCRPTLDKPYSFYRSDRNVYKEKHNMLQLNLEKKIQQNWFTHQIAFNLGFDDFTSALQHKDYLTRRVTATAKSIPGTVGNPAQHRNGFKERPYLYPTPKAELVGEDLCNYKGSSSNYRDCKVRLIKGKNYYFAARNNMALGKYVDLGLGIRYDVSRTKANESTISVGKFKNFSWNTGIVIKPTEWLDLSYRLSTGFRNPSFAEMYGWRYGGNNSDVYVGKFKPETSRNQEFGLALKGDFGNIEISHFSNAYRNLIAFAEELNEKGVGKSNYGYHNAQNAKLVGVNITAQLDFNGLWKRIPYGWYATFAYNRVKVKDQKINAGLASVSSYLFDAIQPSRYIIGLGYDHPSNTWGINTMFTQSKAKSQNELLGQRALGNNSRNIKSTRKLTRAWHILDVSGYYMANKNIMLRLGIYNLFNYRYVTWEAVRQTAQGAVNQHQNVGSYTRYAASGRNYTLTLEMKF